LKPFFIQGFVTLLNDELKNAKCVLLSILYDFKCYMARLAQSKLM
jgi:hypothetical protein